MSEKNEQAPGAGAINPNMPTEELNKVLLEANQQLLAQLRETRAMVAKQNSVEIAWDTKTADVKNIVVKCYGATGRHAANDSISTLVASLVTCQELGFLAQVDTTVAKAALDKVEAAKAEANQAGE